ncbi:MAG: Stk1 family PASTA domain-containing Ser/Thr kinase [Ruminococcaceae bacterium]|nr:Stk1 family PASTA domain-containing Ser/Thr kinase [Oscillospiraceae bacterium]
MDPYIGKTLGNRYEILERIGTGGMAMVYKAKCHYLNRLVAVKILKTDLAQDADFRRRFNTESQAVALLSHPNIVSVYDVSKGGDVEYIVMELMDGITLKQYMEKRGQLSWRESLHFITQIMRALQHAHSRGVVHRDIKPQNMMVLRDGSLKVTDFGIACLGNSAQTLTQEALGSVHYISPEQARGERSSARSDIYSAGVVLYEMLTSRLPFEGDSAVSVAIQHLSSIPLAPRDINEDIPEQLELICMKAMSADAERRYASAEEMIADLEFFRKNPGVTLNFDKEDLHPEEEDEPTRPISAAGKQPVHQKNSAGDEEEPKRDDSAEDEEDYDEDEDDYPRINPIWGRILLMLAGIATGLVALALLLKFVFSSFGAYVTETPIYTVPAVVGYTVEQAQKLPTVQNVFEIKIEEKLFDDTIPAGVIMQQDPSQGTEKKSGLIINVVVSKGPASGVMPSVIGQEARQAEKVILKDIIEAYGLILETESEFSSEYNKGYVMDSRPAAGTVLNKGDTITLFISKGPETTVVPNFVGQNIDRVLTQLVDPWNLGTNGVITYQDSDKEAGIILDQSIPDLEVVDVGTDIDFIVSTGILPEFEMEIGIPLPTDRATVMLRVEVAGRPVYDQITDCSQGSILVTLKGLGMQDVSYYWDGILQATFPQQFE